MPQDNRRPTAPPTVDLLTKWTALALALVLAVPIIVGRHHPIEATAIAATLAAIAGAWPVDRVEGRKRAILGTTTWVLAEYIVAVSWPWGHWWALIPVALVPYGIVLIGAGRGTHARVVKKVAASLPALVASALPPGVKMGKMREKDGKVEFPLTAGTETPRNAMADVAVKVATVVPGAKKGEVRLYDLGDSVEQGKYILEIQQGPNYFEVGMPEPPTRIGFAHLGYERNGKVANIDMQSSHADHAIVGGMTGFGKSETIRKMTLDELEQGAEVWLCDPHGTDDRLIPHLTRYEENGSKGAQFLAEAVELMHKRRATKLEQGSTWKPPTRIVIVIDEAASVLRYKGAAENLTVLVEESRKFGFRVVVGTQSPKAGMFGGGGTRGQFPIRVGHHVADGTESAAVMGEGWVGKGFDCSTLKRQGEAYALLPGDLHPRHIQVWRMRDPDVVLAGHVPLSRPANSERLYAGETEQDTGQDRTQDKTQNEQWGPPRIDALGKWAAPVYDALNGKPIIANQVAERVAPKSRQAIYDTLVRLELAGLVRQQDDGWVRA